MKAAAQTLRVRAERHAALADPQRLHIIDLLALGDAAPVELQAELGISSSLLAHHLRLLEETGFITRRRSEADRRRNYLHLDHCVFDQLIPAQSIAARRVVFVCTGNSARSQLAAALWPLSSQVPVASAGTHPADQVDRGAIAVANRHDVALLSRTPKPLTEVLHPDDFVVTVCDSAHEELAGAGRLHWSIPDPVRQGTDTAFEAAFADISARISGLAPLLIGTDPNIVPTHPQDRRRD